MPQAPYEVPNALKLGLVRDEGIEDRVDSALDDLIEGQAAQQEELGAWLESRRAVWKQRWKEGNGIVAVNELLKLLLSTRASRDELAALLSNKPKLADGFWDFAVIDFTPIKEGGKLMRMFADDRPLRLDRVSPMVRGLRRISDVQISAHAFYFVTGKRGVGAWSEQRLGVSRDRLRGIVAEGLPEFVHDGLKRVIEDMVRRDGRPT